MVSAAQRLSIGAPSRAFSVYNLSFLMEREDLQEMELFARRRSAQKFIDAIVDSLRNTSSIEKFDCGHYSFDMLKDLMVEHPRMLELYDGYMRKHWDVVSVAALFEGAPVHAEHLRPIFDGRPRLLQAYASFALDGLKQVTAAEQQRDEPLQTHLGETRLSTSVDLAVIEGHLAQVAEWQATLRKKLKGAPHREWRVFGGVATLLLQTIEHPDSEVSGVCIRLLPTDTRAYSFLSHTLRLSRAGELDSSVHYNAYQDFGYVPRVGEMNEREVIEAFVTHDLDGRAFTDAIEDAAGDIG